MRRPRFIAFLRRLRTAEHGIAATEFALVLPLMAGAWLTMAQLAQLSEVSGKTSLAAQSLSDLATQPNPPLFSDLVNAVGQMFAPFPTDTTSLTVDEVGMTFNASGTPTQNWRCTSGSNADTSPLANLPSGFAPANQAVIMVTVKYTYTPTITGGILGLQTYTERSFNTPRQQSLPSKPC